MKIQLFAKTVTAFWLGLGITATISQPSYAATPTFFCGTKNGTPATVARTSRGDIPVIRWVSTYFSGTGYTPEKRCIEVSKRFQTYYNNGTLNYITAGTINRQSVVCVAKSPGSGCSDVLFTLENRDNPNHVLQELFNVRLGTVRQPITRGEPETTTQKLYYIDFNKYLSTSDVEKGIFPITQPSPETRQRQENILADNAATTKADVAPPTLGEVINKMNPTEAVTKIEQSWEKDYEGYFKVNLSDSSLRAKEIAGTLGEIASQTGKNSSLE